MTEEVSQAAEQPDKLLDHLRGFIDGIEDRPVLPEQFFTRGDPTIPPGEKKIRYRVLKDTITEFRKTAFSESKRGKKTYEAAYDWLVRNDYDWPFSFVNICDVFNLDSEAVRAALWYWKEQEKERRYAAKTAEAREGAGPECCPSIPPEGWTDEASERTEGRGAEQAA